ncbi:hypothetical protein [Tetragenococcus koreensis]|uniref:sunset domain-containing protein n=1 Tax=Tetragenococcus koreensis TaxID=290335 RepID=UPI001F4244A8|nr:hypothetical protein [Tetragenococcus koreensis]MCF1627473.1 hypothetical protein [Tetragenococcus koreensis]
MWQVLGWIIGGIIVLAIIIKFGNIIFGAAGLIGFFVYLYRRHKKMELKPLVKQWWIYSFVAAMVLQGFGIGVSPEPQNEVATAASTTEISETSASTETSSSSEEKTTKKVEINLKEDSLTAKEDGKVKIKGKTEPDASVSIGMGILGDSTEADGKGNFTLEEQISGKENKEITINAEGKDSDASETVELKQNEKKIKEIEKEEKEEAAVSESREEEQKKEEAAASESREEEKQKEEEAKEAEENNEQSEQQEQQEETQPAEDPSGDQYVDENGNGLIKGSKSKIYHVPGSQYYDQTTNPERTFKSIEEAEDAGYRAPK